MGTRFVKQPNGLLARFSTVVDDFTHTNLTEHAAFDLCQTERDCSESAARKMVQAGMEDWKPWTNGAKGSGLDRWQDALEKIRTAHGDSRVVELESDMTKSPQ